MQAQFHITAIRILDTLYSNIQSLIMNIRQALQ